MRNATLQLKNFLYSRQGFVFADLYTIVLVGGSVKRYTSAGVPVTVDGITFHTGPSISDGGVKQSLGLQVDTLSLSISADSQHLIEGVPLLTFIRMNGFDGAMIQIQRAFAATWEDMMDEGPVGVMTRYKGRFSDVQLTRSQATITVSSWLELMNVDMPADTYQSSCSNVLYDSKCGVDRADWAVSASITGYSTVSSLQCGISSADHTFNMGSLLFVSGPNQGIRRTVKTQVGGLLTLVAPLVKAPSIGDDFTLYPGCLLDMGTCKNKFNNLLNFRGQPFVPVPEAAL